MIKSDLNITCNILYYTQDYSTLLNVTNVIIDIDNLCISVDNRFKVIDNYETLLKISITCFGISNE